jgi:predicted lipoprotein
MVLAAISLTLGSCVPWTVRPIAKEEEKARFDARAYADRAWGKIVAALESSAVDVREALKAPSGTAYVAVEGEAKVLRVNRESRAGTAELDIAPFDGKADAALAIGPVIRGSAVRDATGVVTFNEFVNQLDYADVNNALNDRVVGVLAGSKLNPGAIVTFVGVMSQVGGLSEIVAVRVGQVSANREPRTNA